MAIVEVMTRPFEKVKKLRSLDEVLTRGGQAISAMRDNGQVLTDEEFVGKVDPAQFNGSPIIAESLWQKFYKNGDERFFATFRTPDLSTAAFRKLFGEERAAQVVNAAEKIIAGKIDLLGLTDLYVGSEIDWHLEPLSATRSPLIHWKEFDELNTAKTGNPKILWELNRHQHFFTLGLAFWLTRDERFARTFAKHLESWIEQNPPGLGINWSSSLEVSFRAMSWLWAFHFFKDADDFTPTLFRSALKCLYAHGHHIERYLSTYYSPNTHLTGEGLGLYYLGTQLPFLNAAPTWKKLGEDILTTELSRQILPDGVYFEQSTWYQRYTVDFYSHFVVLRLLAGDPFDPEKSEEFEERLGKAFDFLMHVTAPNGRTPLIGDDDGGRMLPFSGAAPDDFRGSLALGSVVLGRGDHKYASGGASEELFWLTGPDGLASFELLEAVKPDITSHHFTEGGYSVMRDGWESTDNYLLVDCGEVGSLSGAHGHADTLSIAVSVHGKPLLVDSGTYTYHESKPLRDYFRSTVAHNTLVIDGESSSAPGGTFAWKTRADATQERWISEERFDLFEGSHNGFRRLEAAAIHKRSILFLKHDYWIIRDLAMTEGEHEYSLNFHFANHRKPTVSPDGLSIGEDDFRIFTFCDNGKWLPEIGWTSTNHGKRTHATFMQFVASGVGTQEFFTFILPVGDADVEEVAIDEGRAFVIRFAGYTDLFVFGDGTVLNNGLFASDFKYSWARLRSGERRPDEFVLIDGDHFAIDGTDLLGGTNVEYATARRFGDEIYIKTHDRRIKRSISTNA